MAFSMKSVFIRTLIIVLFGLMLPGIAAAGGGTWHMDGNWQDSSGNNNNGTAYNGTTFSTNSKYGTHAGSFNGSNNYVVLKNSALVSNSPQSTVEAWVYPSSACTQTGTIYSENSSGGVVYWVTLSCSGIVTFNIWRSDVSGNWKGVSSSISVVNNAWNHVAATLDSSGMKVYINGVPAGSNTANQASDAGISEVDLGRAANAGGMYYFNGLIDELSVYDRALSAAEIAAHASIIAEYRMDNNWSDSLNSNNGTSYGAAFSASGKSGQAGIFDGISSYVQVPHSENYGFTREFSAALWVKAQTVQNQSFVLLDKSDSNNGWFLKGGANGALEFGFGTGTEFTTVSSKLNLRDDAWHYVVCTYDGADLKIYIDGNLDSTRSENRDIAISLSSLTIGAKNGGTEAFGGLIDELKIYNKALQEIEILRSYDPSLKGFYKMENDGWMDSSGTNNNGTAYGATFTNNARFGSYSGNFDGISNYVNVKSSELISKNSSSTVEAWIFPSSNCSQSGVVYSENSQGGVVFQVYVGCDRFARFSLWRSNISGNWVSVVSKKKLIADSWNHIAATLDSGGMKIYVNGELTGVNTNNNLPTDNTISEVNIGRYNNGGGGSFFKGQIDNLKVYNRALSLEELDRNFNIGRVAYYTFENTLDDSTGNNLDGSSFNGAGFSSTAKEGSFAANLDGVDDYIQVPYSSPFDMRRNISVSYWIKASLSQKPVFSILEKSKNETDFSGWFMQGNSAGNIEWGFGNGADFSSTVTALTDVRDDRWHHIAGTYNGSVLKIYVDGILNNSISESRDIFLNSNPLYIGNHYLGGREFAGILDEVMIYDYELSESEVRKLSDKSLLAHYPMDNSWSDSWVYQFNVTPQNGASFSTDAKLGTHSGSFDGVDDYASGGAGSIRSVSNTFTMEFWANPSASHNITSENTTGIPGTSGQRYAIAPEWGGTSDAGAGVSVGTNGISVFEHGDYYMPSPLVYNATLSGWNHVAVVYENKQPKLYLNGQLVRTGLTSPRANVYPSILFGNVSNYGPYQGLIDEVSIYDRALTASEILAHSQMDGIPPATPTVEPVTSPTAASTITLSGTKEAGTSIWINGNQVLALDQSTTWMVSFNLQQGVNNLSITSKDIALNQSLAANISVIWDNTAPSISGSSPANNSSTNSVNSISISLVDAYSSVDLAAAIAGATVTDSLSQSVPGSWSTGTDTVIFTPQASFAEGTYTVTINPTDSLGNTATAQVVFTYDTTGPPAPGIDVVISPTNATSQTLTGTRSVDTALITVTSAGTVGTVAYPLSTTWSVTISGLVEGANTINVYALDSAGNQSGTTSTIITVDTTPPAAPVVNAVGSPTASQEATLTGSKEANSFIYVNGIKTSTQEEFFLNTWTYTVSLNEGSNSFNVHAKDELGNQSPTVPVSIVRDTTAPYISSSSPSANAFINQSSNIEITLADAYSAVDLQTSLSGATVVNSSGQTVSGTWSVSGNNLVFSPSVAFTDSVYTVTVHPTDALGNTGTAALTFTVDATAPLAQSVTMNPASPHKAETVSFTINFNENMYTGVQPVVSFSRGFLYGSYTIPGGWVDNRTWQGNFIFDSNTGDGTYTITVSSAKDQAQNVMSSQDIGTFVLDTTAPSLPTISAVTTPTKNAYQTINGSKDPDTAIYVDGTQRVSLNPSTSWSYDYPLKEGSNSISVVARDEAGNDSVAVGTSIVLDTTPPAFSITGYQNPSPAATQQITGTKEAGAVIKLNNNIIIDSTDLNTTWAYTVTLTDGITNRLTFVATDALGNSITKSIDILYDTSAPEPMPVGVLIADGSGKGTEATLSWSGFIELPDIAYYKIYYSTSDFSSVSGLTPVGTVNKGTYSFKVSGLVKGTQYYFAVVPVDNSGNYNASVYAVGAIPVDTIAPEEVSGLAAQAGYDAVNGNYVTLNWSPSANSAGDLTDQVIFFDNGFGYDAGTPVGSSAVTYTKNGLADATKYKFKVSTKDTDGHESAGVVIDAVTRLDNPAGLSASPGNAKISLSWNTVNSAYVKEYRVYRSSSPVTDVGGMTPLQTLSGTSFTDTGVVNGNTYHYAVTVLNTSGAERTSVQSISAAPRQDETGPAISGLNLTANQVVASPLTITASAQDSESQMDRLEVYVDSVLSKTQAGSSISFYWNILDTTDGNHSIKVSAYDSLGNSTSVTVPAIVSAAPPSAPAISTHSVVQTTPSYLVDIPGTASLHTTVTLKVNGAVWGQTSTAADGTFSFNSVALVEGDNLISAKASHRGGESVFTDHAIVVDSGAPNPPVNLSAKALPGGTVQLTWQSGTGEAPSGYNIYAGEGSFTSKNDTGVVKINSAPITFLYTEYVPVDDTLRHYAVTAVDSSGNESGLSNLFSIASDRALPSVASIRFSYTDQSGNITDPASIGGPGKVKASVESTEPLSELPFLSLEPQSGSPVVFSLKKIDDTHFEGTINVNALTPHGLTTYKFSAKDVVGNRGNGQGSGISIDVQGPAASITSPVSAVQKGASVGVTVSFDEVPTKTPILSISDGINTAQVSNLTSSDGLVWSGFADLSNLSEGTVQFSLNEVTDGFGNISTSIVSGGSIALYSTTPPAPATPSNFSAAAKKGRGVDLTWNAAADAESFKIYRRAEGETTPVQVATAAKGAVSASLTVPADGVYYFSISSVGLLDSESQKSAEATVTADGTAPSSPTGLSLSLTGSGTTVSWTAVDGASSYKIYRSSASISDVTGLTPVETSTTPGAVDPSPTSSMRFYAVTALDALGNESAPSQSSEIVFQVAPPKDLVLSKVDNGKPTLTWAPSESNLQGYHIYRNASRITQSPTPTASYTDNYYSGGTVTYGISQVDGSGNESPMKEVTLHDISIGLKDGATLRRGVIETVPVVLSSSANITVSSIEIKVGASQSSSLSGPFTLAPGNNLTVEKVAAAEANASEQVAVVTTAVMTSPGATVRVQKTSLANVLGSGTALEIFNDPLVKGGQAKIKLKVNNLGSAQTEFLTSQNNGPTSEVKVMLKDQDGNLLGQGYLNQRTGKVVNSGNYALARLSPGENILTEPVTFNIPASAPYKVRIEAEILNTYYNYNQSGMVTAPGLRQSIETTIAETSYTASASAAKSVYKQGEAVTITGQAVSTSAGTPMPLVSVKLGISVKGFDRFYTLTTDEQGNFSYTFTPGTNEAGTYSIWAVHPDISDRTVQAQFNVVGLEMTPTFAEIKISKNSTYDIPVTLKNISDVSLSGVSFTASASTGLTASAVNAGGDVMAPNETRSFNFRVSSASNAPETGYAALNISAVVGSGPDTVSSALNANVALTQAIPVIKTSPSYIDTGVVNGKQKSETFTISNTGLDALKNARIEGPFLSWITLTVSKTLGDIQAGSSKSVGLLIKPGDTLAQGIYDDRIVVYSDNHIPYTFNIQVTVTSNAVGNVMFDVLNELMQDVSGATITLQNQSLPELIYTATTGADGTVSIYDVPEGRYSFSVTATGHKSYSGSITVVSGLTVVAPIALEVNLIEVEWSVVPITIEDRYEIKISQVFETNVPTAVLVVEPAGVTVPDIQPGEVFNGEFTITNYGLTSVDYKGLDVPTSAGDYDIEVLATFPATIGAMQKITVPYRITRRQQ